MNLKDAILKRYHSKEKIEEGYYLRVRKNKMDSTICVYYNGIETMIYENNNILLKTAIFMPNRSNVFESRGCLKEPFCDRKIPQNVKEDMDTVDAYFDFTIGNYLKGSKRKKLEIGFSTNLRGTTQEQLKQEVEEKIKNVGLMHYFEEISLEKNKILLFLRKNILKLTEIYNLLIPLLEITLANNRLHKIEVEIKSQLKKELDFDVLESALTRRNHVYTGKIEDLKNDYHTSKTDTNQEKQKQQEFMVLLNKESKSDIWYQTKTENKEILFSKDTYPFELEYTIYAGNPKAKVKEEKRAKSNITGRIDNTAFDNNTLRLIEIKYGTGVIDGSNGIHKHLIDLYSCLTISKDVILEEFKKRMEYRNNVLDQKNENLKIDSHMIYDIICIYSEKSEDKILTKESVKQKIDEIYDKTTLDPIVGCNIHNVIDTKLENYRNANQYPKELLEKNIEELCMLLKNKDCTVRILLVDDEFRRFEEYQPVKK